MRIMLIIVSTVAAVLGSALLAAALFANRNELLNSGTSILIASLVALTAAAGLVTYRDERKKSRYAKQEDSYVALLQGLLGRFLADGQDRNQAVQRANLVLWADKDAVEALSAWNAAYDENVPQPKLGEKSVVLSPEQSAAMQAATVEVARQLRVGVSKKKVSTEHLSSALFNKTRSDEDQSKRDPVTD